MQQFQHDIKNEPFVLGGKASLKQIPPPSVPRRASKGVNTPAFSRQTRQIPKSQPSPAAEESLVGRSESLTSKISAPSSQVKRPTPNKVADARTRKPSALAISTKDPQRSSALSTATAKSSKGSPVSSLSKTGEKATASTTRKIGNLEKPPTRAPVKHQGPKVTETATVAAKSAVTREAKNSSQKTNETKTTKPGEKSQRQEKKGNGDEAGDDEDDKKKVPEDPKDYFGSDRVTSDQEDEGNVPLMTLKSIRRQMEREGGELDYIFEEEVRRKKTDPIELELLGMEVEEEINRLKQRIQESDEEEDILVEGLHDVVGEALTSRFVLLFFLAPALGWTLITSLNTGNYQKKWTSQHQAVVHCRED